MAPECRAVGKQLFTVIFRFVDWHNRAGTWPVRKFVRSSDRNGPRNGPLPDPDDFPIKPCRHCGCMIPRQSGKCPCCHKEDPFRSKWPIKAGGFGEFVIVLGILLILSGILGIFLY